jgi:hypothetical protein
MIRSFVMWAAITKGGVRNRTTGRVRGVARDTADRVRSNYLVSCQNEAQRQLISIFRSIETQTPIVATSLLATVETLPSTPTVCYQD